jgi:hypothetical protein
MYRSSRTVAAVLTAGAISIGCAMSSPADVPPTIDPSLPAVDAGNNPVPGRPGADGSDASADASGPNGNGNGNAATEDGGSGAKPAFAGDDAGSGLPKPAAGEVLITEITYSTFTPEPASEWIEIYSKASSARSLSGLTLKDGGGRTHVIAAGLAIAPGAYVILARDKTAAISAKVPAAAIVYEYGTGLPDNAGIVLANGSTGGISLLDGTTTLVSVPYGPWFSQSGGSSLELKGLDASQESTSAGWCIALKTWTTGSEKGTPGAANDCP